MKRVFRITDSRPDPGREVHDEVEFHLEMRTREFVEQGMSPEDARRAAVEAFGDPALIERQLRTHRTRRDSRHHRSDLMLGLWQDVRYAVRTLSKSPAFTLVAILTLGLGIGATTALFSVINGVLIQRLPFDRGERLVQIRQPEQRNAVDDVGFSVAEIGDYRAQTTSFDGIVEYHSMSFNLYGKGEPIRVRTGVVSDEWFDLMGIAPLMGRTFREGEDLPGAEPVLVLSHGFWMNTLGGDPGIVGETFTMNDRVHTVVGVLPPLPQYPDENDVYMPVSSCPFRSAERMITTRTARMMSMFGKLRPGATVEQAQHELGLVASRLHGEHEEAYPAAVGLGIGAVSLHDVLSRDARPTFFILLGTAGLVLLLACTNVANLAVARQMRRERELAVRAALGAGRGRLFRQLLVESTILGIAGGAFGLLIAFAGLDLLADFASRFTARAGEIRIDAPVLGFAVGISLLTGLAVGVLPALTSKVNLVAALKEGGERAGAGVRRIRLRSALVVAQIALAFMLLAGAGLMVRSLVNLLRVDPGFDPQNVLTMRLFLNWSHYTTPDQRRQFYEQLLARLEGQPGITSVAVSSAVPLDDNGPFRRSFEIEGQPVGDDAARPQADFRAASPDYFRTIGVPLMRGRAFTAADRDSAPPVLIVTESLARRYFPGEDPVGKRLTPDNGATWLTIVGVVGDVRQYGLDQAPREEAIAPFAQTPIGGNLMVRTPGDPERLARSIAAAVHAIDPETAITDVQTLQQLRSESIASPRLTTVLLTMFAILALVITAIGVGSVVAFAVAQRTHEIGVRIALGAETGEVIRMVLRQGMLPVVAGVLLGVGGAIALTRLISGLLFEVQATDLITYGGVALMLIAVAAGACFLPARRATAIQPLIALRSS